MIFSKLYFTNKELPLEDAKIFFQSAECSANPDSVVKYCIISEVFIK